MIERFPEGTDTIPYPHKIINWRDGSRTLDLRVEPGGMLSAPPPPKIEGWAVHFVGHHADHTAYSYRPAPPPARPEWRRQVRKDSAVLYAIGCCIEDRESLDDEQLDHLWQQLVENGDHLWDTLVGRCIDLVEERMTQEVPA